MSSTTSLLAGLVQGYTGEKARLAHEELTQRALQQQNMLQYLSHLASNPNVPPEHQQWAMGKIQELIQADPAKKLPKVDMAELPAVNVPAGPTRTATPPPVPAMTLQPPVGPGSQAAPSGNVGRASDSTVNALGASGSNMGQPSTIRPPMGPNPVATANDPQFDLAPPQPVTLPPVQQSQIANPTPPVPISPAGQIHLLTPEDRAKYPQPPTHDKFTLTPGEKRYEDGKVVAENKDTKPGAKSGFEPKMGPGGPIGVTDVATGGMLTPEQVAANPQAKAVLEQAKAEYQTQQDAQDARDEAKAKRAQDLADQHEEAGRRKLVYGQAVDAAKKAKPMVDVLDASEAYMKEGVFTPRQDLALIVRAVRAMNPGTVRLPQKELELELKAGSYGDRFARWFDTASQGVLPADQRQDLMNVIRKETTTTATSAANDWRESFKGTKEEEPPTYLRRFEAKAADAGPPEGASHEVYAADGKTLLGHAVNGKFVPLGQEKK